MRHIYLFLSVAFNVASYLLYKSISHKPSSAFWFIIFFSGLILGSVNVLFFTKALKDMSLSIACPGKYGVCDAQAHVIFGEKISAINMVGAAVVVVGIALLSR